MASEMHTNERRVDKMKSRNVKELVAMSLIGDGMLTAIDPERHLQLWRFGPRVCTRTIDALARRPLLTRLLGVAATITGLWWASRQKPRASVLFARRSA
jgi:hypothetical protein